MDSSRATISRLRAHPRRAWSSTVTFCPSVLPILARIAALIKDACMRLELA